MHTWAAFRLLTAFARVIYDFSLLPFDTATFAPCAYGNEWAVHTPNMALKFTKAASCDELKHHGLADDNSTPHTTLQTAR